MGHARGEQETEEAQRLAESLTRQNASLEELSARDRESIKSHIESRRKALAHGKKLIEMDKQLAQYREEREERNRQKQAYEDEMCKIHLAGIVAERDILLIQRDEAFDRFHAARMEADKFCKVCARELGLGRMI